MATTAKAAEALPNHRPDIYYFAVHRYDTIDNLRRGKDLGASADNYSWRTNKLFEPVSSLVPKGALLTYIRGQQKCKLTQRHASQ